MLAADFAGDLAENGALVRKRLRHGLDRAKSLPHTDHCVVDLYDKYVGTNCIHRQDIKIAKIVIFQTARSRLYLNEI